MFSHNASAIKTQSLKKGKLLGQKRSLRLKEIWAIQTKLQQANRYRDLALFNLAIDSNLKRSHLVKLRVRDIVPGTEMVSSAIVLQQKNKPPARFEIADQTWETVAKWINVCNLNQNDYLFPSRNSASPHISTRQYSRIVDSWVACIGLDPALYGTHSMLTSQAHPDLQEDNESQGRQSDAWTFEAGEHRALSREMMR